MTSRYPGSCAICGNRFPAGADIDYDRNTRGAAHWACKQGEKPLPEGTKTYQIGGGSGYGCDGWAQGQVVRASQREREQHGYPEFLFVLRANRRYIREDGMSFGVGDESGYLYTAACREATGEEAAPLVERERVVQARKEAQAALDVIRRDIQERGERPEGTEEQLIVDGERLFDTQNVYGGGDWFVVQPDAVWFIRNNGADGDNWSRNNVRTGGAGAIGWKVGRTAELVDKLYSLRNMLVRD